MVRGLISHMQRYSTQDGPGIRTTVFLMGCPLHCIWCSNPELLEMKQQLMHFPARCRKCQSCLMIDDAIFMKDDGIHFDRREIRHLNECAEICPFDAYEVIGKWVEADELAIQLCKDEAYYRTSQGGVTFSGGEALLQSSFVKACAQKLKERGIHVAIDTCGYVEQERILDVLDVCDLFLYDIKSYDAILHQKCTQHDNAVILDNLRYLDQQKANVWIRLPLVHGYNTDWQDIIRRLDLIASLTCVKRVDVLPYHNLGEGKYQSLQMPYQVQGDAFIDETLRLRIQEEGAKRNIEIHVK